MSIISASAKFTPTGDVSRLVDLYVQVKLFGKVQRAQAVVVEEAKLLCPVNTGELAGSIHATEPVNDGHRITGQVVADSGHAAFVEFGTGIAGAGTYPGELPQQGVPYTGSWVYDYKQQNWPGMVAQPYMRPALDISRERVLAEFYQ